MRAARAAAGLSIVALLVGLPQGGGAESRGVSASRDYEFRIRSRLQPASAKVFAVCFSRLPGDIDVSVGLGLAASGDVEFVEVLRSTGDDTCDSAIVDAVWDAGPFPQVPLELLARVQPGGSLVIPIDLGGTRGAVALGPVPARTSSAVVPAAIVMLIATASAAVRAGAPRQAAQERRRHEEPRRRSRRTHASTVRRRGGTGQRRATPGVRGKNALYFGPP